jgi:hypothetical protein
MRKNETSSPIWELYRKRCHENATRKHIYSGTIFLRSEICEDEKSSTLQRTASTPTDAYKKAEAEVGVQQTLLLHYLHEISAAL